MQLVNIGWGAKVTVGYAALRPGEDTAVHGAQQAL